MKNPKIPANEKERLKVLEEYQILDTLPEDLYDDITEIASQICNTPISLISLIDDSRQWFKSHHGLDVSETPKDVAYCAHAINEPDKILEVPDAFEDERFHDNPLATGDPHVRFYAGAPLKTKDGHTLGTLCVIDHEKRKLTAEQKKTLWALSRQVVALLELRKENHQRVLIDQDLTTLLENLGDGVFELDASGNCIYVNSRMLEMLKRSYEEVMKTSIWKLIYSEDVAEMQKFYIEQFKKKATYCYYEYRITCRGNKPVWVGQSTTMQYEGNEMVKLRSIARDLTKTKFLEEELQLKDTLYKLVSENSSDLIAVHELDATYKFVSPSCQDLLGYMPSDLIGKSPFQFMHPDDVPKLQQGAHQSTKEGHSVTNVEYRFQKKDGSYLWLESYSNPIKDSSGKVSSFQTSSRDITGRKVEQERNEKYKEGLTILNQLASSSLTGSELLDDSLKRIAKYLDLDNGIISEVFGKNYLVRNSYLKELSGLKFRNPYLLEGTYCDFALKCETALLIDEQSDFEYAGHPCFSKEKIGTYIGTTILKKGAKYGTVNFSSEKRRSKKFAHFEGEFIQLFANWIGSVLEAEEEKILLEEAITKAEEASHAKDSFLSMMSHEIRTPLNGIIGTTHLLLDKSPRQEQLPHLNILRQSSDNLHAIVNDILDFNKIEEGKLEIDRSAFDLRDLVGTIHKNYEQQGAEKGIAVILDFDPSLAFSYLGDSVRIGQILHNLMNNAIKFTDDGQVDFKISVTRKHNVYDELHFEVSDSGIGIPKEKHKEIFEIFTQQDKSTTRKFGGSGLGLAIIKRLLELMESEIQLDSSLGEGAKFSFDLVLETTKGNSEQLRKETQTQFLPLSARILLVEDNAFNMVIAKDFLQSWGCEVLEATNGREALDLLEATNVDLVLLDLQMPVLDGFETIKAIRQSSKKEHRELPVIALTAAALGDIQEKVFQAGMNDFITKPFLPADFYTKLSKRLQKDRSPEGEDVLSSIRTKLTDTIGVDGNIDRYLKIFAETLKNESASLGSAIDSRDISHLKSYAHKNKSSFRLVGLDTDADAADEIEKMIDRESPPKMIFEKASKHLSDVTNILEKMNPQL